MGAPWGLWGSPESSKVRGHAWDGALGQEGLQRGKKPQSKEVRGREGALEEKGLLTGWGAGLAGSRVDRRSR